MASSAWQSEVSATDRYDMIRTIKEAVGSMSEAIASESRAYADSSSLQDYQTACASFATSKSPPFHPEALEDSSESETGIRIGDYQNCHFIGDGITSEVYRSSASALKVIVNYQNIEPHNPQREIKILEGLADVDRVVRLEKWFRDQEQRLVLVFPYMPLTLAGLLEKNPSGLDENLIRSIFHQIFSGLRDIHNQGIIHRDIKPSAILLSSTPNNTYKAYLSDFGTAWHPILSTSNEPSSSKILDIGTGAYRAPEVLFGNASYNTSVDMWAAGVMLNEALSVPPKAMFESRGVHEDGNQLGLILSIFKTLGTPTKETWPEAENFKVQPFELWTKFEGSGWGEKPEGVKSELQDLAKRMVRFESGDRITAAQALEAPCMKS